MNDNIFDRAVERSFLKEAQKLKGKTLLIYGAGGFGLEMLRALAGVGISVSAFLDRRATELPELESIPVYCAEDAPFNRSSAVVLFSIVMDKDARRDVMRWLAALGYEHIVEAQSLRCLSVQPDDGAGKSVEEYYHERRGRILEAEALFDEERSRAIFNANVSAHITGDYEMCAYLESPMDEQYFPPDIYLSRGYRRFVDCGGYIGDTAKSLLERIGSIDVYAGFEPNSRNYKRLARQMDELSDKIACRLAFPCAVAGRTELSRFLVGTGSGMLSSNGESVVQTVTLDQSIPDLHPTFIKMDIEGAELAAIHGARRLICEDRPDLAICVYHAVNHIWDIPILLNDWELGYRFYLRCYNAYTMETVLYATVPMK